MDNLNDCIMQIADDCFKNVSPSISLNELSVYCSTLLLSVYDKKTYDKEVFQPWLKQLIAQLYPSKFGHHFNNFKIIDRNEQVNKLKNIPVIEQRSEEWYRIKEDSIGASECATIFGDNPYQTKNQLILKKCGHKENKEEIPSVHITHGVKYEPIIQRIYEDLHNTQLLEFGSIKHPNYSFISASPDGITPTGVMIEIKAPYARIINGIPPKYYWYQMQQQLQVCGLDKVDFVECKITEYHNFDDYKADFYDDPNEPFNKLGKHKGTLLVCIDNQATTEYKPYFYVYPPKFLKTNEIQKWLNDERKKIEKEGRYMFCKNVFWTLEIYKLTEVWRDDEWWNKHIHLYIDMWKEVEQYRKSGIESLLNKKTTTRTYKPKIEDCMINTDDDTHRLLWFEYDHPDDIESYFSDNEINELNNTCLIYSTDDSDIDTNIKPNEKRIMKVKKSTIPVKKQTNIYSAGNNRSCMIDSDDD